MGIFYDQTEVINRTSKMLNVRFDGQDIDLKPNYTADGKAIKDVHNMLPRITVAHAKSQNVLNGSEDPQDPSYWIPLVGVKDSKDDCGFCEQDLTVLTRVKLDEYLDDPSVKITVAGRRVRVSESRPEGDKAPFDMKPRT